MEKIPENPEYEAIIATWHDAMIDSLTDEGPDLVTWEEFCGRCG
jgi:hypothetical protein